MLRGEDGRAAERHAAELGIHQLRLPTPFAIGDVNAYLIEDDPLTLVDCGPNSAAALEALEEGLAAKGHAVSDLELIILTHQHVDHCGLAWYLGRRSGAEIACWTELAPVLAEWEQYAERSDDDTAVLMRNHGVAPPVVDALRSAADSVRPWGHRVHASWRLGDGDVIALRDRSLRVRYRPGHSPSDLLLHDEASAVAFTGDHLLSRVSSNAVVARPLGVMANGVRPTPLLDYRRSLLATRAHEFQIGLGGHGAAVTDHNALIDARLAGQRERAQRFLAIVERGPCTAHEIATATWGPVAITQALLTLSEVLGTLDLLIEDGVVAEVRDLGPVRFRIADAPAPFV